MRTRAHIRAAGLGLGGVAASLWLLAAPAGAAPRQVVAAEPVVSGLDLPLGLTHAGDGSGRLFILQQNGLVRIYDDGELLADPFLDLSTRVSCCGERGLLGLAFHPRYRRNGRFFVSYTDRGGRSVISRFVVSGDPDRADAGSERVVLSFEQPFSNHNGGHLAFGPDGLLYVGSGDGGSGGDPQNNGQQLETFLGKILRLDVDRGTPYTVPRGNPFAGRDDALGEIWAYGLRNPWRFSFDRTTGDLYIGDVGQGSREEIDFQVAASSGGVNYGWRRMEGSLCFDPASACNDGSLELPILEYGHDVGCSVTGGYRYRGGEDPGLERFYLFGDFCSGRVWGGWPLSDGSWSSRAVLSTPFGISSFGEDEAGALYLVDYGGAVYRLVGEPIFRSDFESGTTDGWRRERGPVTVAAPGLRGSGAAMELTIGRRSAWVESRRPKGEPTFRVGFDLLAEGLELDDPAEILRIRGGGTHVVVALDQAGGETRLHLLARQSTVSLEDLGSARIRTGRTVGVEVDWVRAAAGAANGSVRLLVNGSVAVEAGGLDNRRFSVKSVRLGLPSGASGSGSLRLDNYLSRP